jgi:hypothetical protein
VELVPPAALLAPPELVVPPELAVAPPAELPPDVELAPLPPPGAAPSALQARASNAMDPIDAKP